MITSENTATLEEACRTVSCGCALERLDTVLNTATYSLIQTGQSIGLSRYECEGIMDGWDVSVGRSTVGCFHWAYYPEPHEMTSLYGAPVHEIDKRDEYEAGRALGKRLAQAYGSVIG